MELPRPDGDGGPREDGDLEYPRRETRSGEGLGEGGADLAAAAIANGNRGRLEPWGSASRRPREPPACSR